MTPQSHFMVIAAIDSSHENSLREMLDSMNSPPGMANPENTIFPFGRFRQLHYARFVILADPTQEDILNYGLQPPNYPTYLAFFGDCDGCPCAFLAEAAQYAEAGLRQIFRHCPDFNDETDLLAWMQAHDQPVAAFYVNWLGRTVNQIMEENALQRALSAKMHGDSRITGEEPQALRQALKHFVKEEISCGRLSLTAEIPTSIARKVIRFFGFIKFPVLLIIALPFLLALSPYIIFRLRSLEISDPEICPRPSVDFLYTLKRLEDHDVTNQYTALGALKPGLFRRWLLTFLLILANYASSYIFNRGHLARVQTIHFARWVFIDNKSRLIFASNYDGSHEAYMDDFINKVAWGLNLLFSNGIGWPRTDWLIKRGAWTEQKFKYFQRRHQLPTQVWYKAYPGLTLSDINRNQLIRQGLERESMTNAEALEWLRLL